MKLATLLRKLFPSTIAGIEQAAIEGVYPSEPDDWYDSLDDQYEDDRYGHENREDENIESDPVMDILMHEENPLEVVDNIKALFIPCLTDHNKRVHTTERRGLYWIESFRGDNAVLSCHRMQYPEASPKSICVPIVSLQKPGGMHSW